MALQFNFMQRRWFKQLKMLLAFAFVFTASIFCAITDHPIRGHLPIFTHVIGWIGIVFFGLCGIILLYRELRFRGGSQAIITDEGLYILGEYIPWSVITAVKPWGQLHEFQGLAVMTTNCEELIAAAPWWKRWNMRLNYKQYGAVYFIPNEMFEGSREAFIEACMRIINKETWHSTAR